MKLGPPTSAGWVTKRLTSFYRKRGCSRSKWYRIIMGSLMFSNCFSSSSCQSEVMEKLLPANSSLTYFQTRGTQTQQSGGDDVCWQRINWQFASLCFWLSDVAFTDPLSDSVTLKNLSELLRDKPFRGSQSLTMMETYPECKATTYQLSLLHIAQRSSAGFVLPVS